MTANAVSDDPFEALGDDNRRVIVELLHDGPMSVADISRRMPISQPAVSRHLRLLKQARLVTDERNGARRMYHLSDEGADVVRAYMQRVWGEAAVRFRLAAENTRGRHQDGRPPWGEWHNRTMRGSASRSSERPVSPWCPEPVRLQSMTHRWETLTFLHWRYRPETIQRLLPAGLQVETIDGAAWVGLVPFTMQVTLPHSGPVPWLSRFPETNVRTYAVSSDGRRGVWFLSLDAGRLAAVMTARSTYRLPYFWSAMRTAKAGPVVIYECRRRWPRPAGARSEVAVEVGPRLAPEDLGDLDHWLTARFGLFSASAGRLRYARAEHQPWPLYRAAVLQCDDQLIEATGLPAPQGPPLVHWSPGVEVRIGFPRGVHGGGRTRRRERAGRPGYLRHGGAEQARRCAS
jgi:uncharacterized protein